MLRTHRQNRQTGFTFFLFLFALAFVMLFLLHTFLFSLLFKRLAILLICLAKKKTNRIWSRPFQWFGEKLKSRPRELVKFHQCLNGVKSQLGDINGRWEKIKCKRNWAESLAGLKKLIWHWPYIIVIFNVHW